MLYRLSKQIIRLVSKESLYNLLRKYYYKIIFPEKRIINKSMVKHNEEIFQKLKINLNNLKKILSDLGIEYHDCSKSWHYHLFAGIHDICAQSNLNVKNILEIGTDTGDFANFLSHIYNHSQIYTVDLPEDDPNFNKIYGREDDYHREYFFKKRKVNIMPSNINFIKLNSTKLLKEFTDIKFDIIWIDGDHYNPQVTIDIMNSMQLAHEKSIICVDDICTDNYKKNYASNESYQTLKNLEKNQVLKNYFIYKRVLSNQNPVKFISCSFFQNIEPIK